MARFCLAVLCLAAAPASVEALDQTGVAAIILLPIMCIFFLVCAILSFTGFFGGDSEPQGERAPEEGSAIEGVVGAGAVEMAPPEKEKEPLTPEEVYKKCFELFAKGS